MRLSLAEATWTDVRNADVDRGLLPVGSTEQHGPHAPLGTDTFHATRVAEAGAERHDETVAVAPAVPVGVAEEHRAFDGTLWVSPDTFRATVRETVASLAHHGIDDVVVVNGHGGNVGPVREATARVTRDGVAHAVPFTWFDAVDADDADADRVELGHGGAVETALLRHTHPDLVREDRTAEARDGAGDAWGEWVAGANVAHDADAFAPNGVVGDPTVGDAATGERLLDAAASALDEVLAVVAGR